ncbi:tyrosine-type recombinase/integrase [Alteribacillus sp. JSM 102045]|uniref:tyrosine-type recombinase/integrase n=1 Tax=Alteribacillus sp. JSM 102045 TaxID=1562101 RepID=UPI0035C15AD3
MEFTHAVDDFLMHLEVEKNYSTNTLRGYAYDLKCFEDFLHHHDRSTALNEINPSTVRRYIQDQVLNFGIKPRTMQRRISSLKSFCQFSLKENYINLDFTAGIQSPKADKNLPRYMRLDELKQLFAYLEQENGPYALRNELLFKCLATSGMRRQELVDLKWEHIDLNNETILIRGKGNKERLLPLHQMVIPLFHQYRKQLLAHQLHDSQPVFINRYGNQMNPRGLHVMFKRILEKAGLPPHRFSLHHLRHTFATLLLQDDENNVDVRTLQELLGHESLATTSMYTHIDFKQKKKAISSFMMS